MKSELKLTEVCVTLDLHVAACANVLLGMFFISLERFSKPNFGSNRRFRTMTGLEIEN